MTSTSSSKLNSQNGSLRLLGLMTLASEPKQRPNSLWPFEQEDAQFGPGFQDRVEDDRDAAGFADPGRAEHREMLFKEIVERDARGNGLVVMQRANRHRPFRAGIDEAQFVASDHAGRVADGGIGGGPHARTGPCPCCPARSRPSARCGRRRRTGGRSRDTSSLLSTSVIMPIRRREPAQIRTNTPTVARN